MHAPPEAWPVFAPAQPAALERPGAHGERPTVFDLVRSSGRRYLYLGRPASPLDTKANRRLFDERWRGDEALVFVQCGEPDGEIHRAAPEGSGYARALGEADEALRAIHARTGPGTRTVAFGDHGALPVRRRIDVASVLRGLRSRPWREFDYFLDSTAARFWFASDRARREVLEALEPCGRWLAEEERARYRVRFGDRRQWEELLLLEPGDVIEPCFYHSTEPVQGMHGYRPEVLENQAALVVHDPRGTAPLAEVHDMVDVFGLVRDLLG